MAKRPIKTSIIDPDELEITIRRAEYLAKETGLDAKVFKGKKIAEIHELLKWKIDPKLLFFRRVCGQVVKRDADGNLCPVSGATVHVEDTDCSFLGFFPKEPPFFWLFPTHCHREEITTVTTDACGRFCVHLPYWDIDRILRFRRERICIWDLYKPRLRDLLERLPEFRIPIPDPGPLHFDKFTPDIIEQVRSYFGSDVAQRLGEVVATSEIGAPAHELDRLLSAPLPKMSPPMAESRMMRKEASAFAERAKRMGVDNKIVQKIDYRKFIGPFIACRDIWYAEWVPFLDIPDITFRVTQDVDGNGTEDEIYREGFFDVRWNAESDLNVTLIADASAHCSPICGSVGDIPCADVPKISTAGYMTLESSHHDNTTGYGTRVNRPVPAPGDYPPPPVVGGGAANAVSPYARTLNLHGCHRIDDATHYRLTYVINGVGTPKPFTNISWWAPKSAAAGGPPIHVTSDSDGWYPILDASLVEHPSWLLYWNTRQFSDATYDIRVEVGKVSSGSMLVLQTSDPVKFVVDNSVPELSFATVQWRYAGTTDAWVTLPAACPIITRDPTRAITVRVNWRASSDHLRDALISFTGCGGNNPHLVEPTPAAPDIEEYRHWHMNEFDNTVIQTNEYLIPAAFSHPAGCYTLHLKGTSRAFNPSGFDHGPGNDWLINQGLIWLWSHRSISIVDA
jgi:hypothetical protein